jgi:Tol biopolymer transport system component
MRNWHKLTALVLSLLAFALLTTAAAAAATTQTHRASINSAGFQGNGDSGNSAPSVSANGRYVAFDSAATNMIPNADTNGFTDVFVRDRTSHKTVRVSVGQNGVQGNEASYSPSISASGRYVSFVSDASNLVPGDTNNSSDVFVRDRKLHKTFLVSVSSLGVEGNMASYSTSISANGRYVTFASDASNLVPGDTNNSSDVFVRDRKLHKTSRVSVDSAGVQANSFSDEAEISAGGRYVAFRSMATNLVAGDTNGFRDVFVRDRKLHTTVRVSVDSAGAQGNSFSDTPSISANGRFVAFRSESSNLVSGDTPGEDVFVRDRKLHTTSLVSVDSAGVPGNGGSNDPVISPDGRYVAFDSDATNLVAGDTNAGEDVFVRDRSLHKTFRVSVTTAGVQGDSDSFYPALSADRRFVAFASNATNLVSGDTNGFRDVFARGPLK